MQVNKQAERPRRRVAVRHRFPKSFQELQEGTLQCKLHRETTAFAVCDSCGQGVCRKCTVILGKKRYCGTDAEATLRRVRTVSNRLKRGRAVTAASTLSCVQGSIATIAGVLFIVLGLVGPSMQKSSGVYPMVAPTFSAFTPIFAFQSGTILALGVVIFSLGILNLVAGIMLWRSSRFAGLMGITLALVVGLVAGTYFAAFAVVAFVAYSLIALAVADVGTILAGWGRLR